MWMYNMWPYPYVASGVLTCCLGLVTFAVVFYFHRKRQFRFFKNQNIPGPEPSLFFGNVTETLAKGFTQTVYEWGQQYGPTFGYYEGPLPVLVTSDLDLLQQILVKQFHYFHGRKLYPVQPVDGDRENSFLVLADGPNWKRVRTIVNPSFTTLKMKQITPLMNRCIDVLMGVISEKTDPEVPVEVYGLFSSFTMDVIVTTAFGLDIDCQRKDSTFKSKCKQVMEHFGSFDLLDVLCVAFSELRGFWTWWSFCRNLSPHPFEWVKKRAGEMVELRINDESSRRVDLMQIMLNTSVMGDRDRKPSVADRNRKPSVANGDSSADRERKLSPETLGETMKTALTNGLRRMSIMDSYGNTGDRRPSMDGASGAEPLSLKELRANIALFLVVGFDTTSALLGYMAYDLALNPDVQQKLYTEIVEELDDKEDLTYEDVHKLSYLDMVIKESLRMHPIVSNEIFCRRCCVDCVEMNGIKFVKNMVVKPDVISVHFNQEQWGPVDVNTFYPERHLPECYENRHPLAFLPFGFGPRICVGMRYALLMVKLAAVRTFRQFKVCKSDDTVPIVTKEDGTIVPLGVHVILQERSSTVA